MFHLLQQDIEFERLGPDRWAANVAIQAQNGAMPVVRTTTAYTLPTQIMSPALHDLARKVARDYCLQEDHFNNAMVEIYGPSYTKMGFHTDQALDLSKDSKIAIWSFYELPEDSSSRRLVTKNKKTAQMEQVEEMRDQSVILFDKEWNRGHVHKIVVNPQRPPLGKWLGVTLRKSKTFVIRDKNGIYFSSPDSGLESSEDALRGSPCRIATPDEKRIFIHLKSRENRESDFEWPDGLDFSLGNL